MSSVRETCACGATFDYTSTSHRNSGSECMVVVGERRRHHRHETPEPPAPEIPEPDEAHDSTLNAQVERAYNEPDSRAELDARSTIGFQP